MYNNFNARSFYIANHELIWGRHDGKTAMFDKTAYLDFGRPYQSHWYSKCFDMDDANMYKQFREFFIVAQTFDINFSDITVTFEIDYDDVKNRIIIQNQISLWGHMNWGDRFITRNIIESIPFIIGRRGRNIKFKLSCSYDTYTDVMTYSDLNDVTPKHDGLLVYVINDDKFYLYMDRQWNEIELTSLNQRMKVYQINGDYEMRGKR
jgi:hypothetical protein